MVFFSLRPLSPKVSSVVVAYRSLPQTYRLSLSQVVTAVIGNLSTVVTLWRLLGHGRPLWVAYIVALRRLMQLQIFEDTVVERGVEQPNFRPLSSTTSFASSRLKRRLKREWGQHSKVLTVSIFLQKLRETLQLTSVIERDGDFACAVRSHPSSGSASAMNA